MINEAIGLASMNPMVGINNTPDSGKKQSLIVINNLEDKDKDLSSWGKIGIMSSLDSDKRITLNDEGKLVYIENTDLEGKNIDMYIYITNEDYIDNKLNSLTEELRIDINNRPIHEGNYLLEFILEKPIYTEDQLDYDMTFNKIYFNEDKSILEVTESNNNDMIGLDLFNEILNFNPEGYFNEY